VGQAPLWLPASWQVKIDVGLSLFYGAESPAIDTIDDVGPYKSKKQASAIDSPVTVHDAPAFVGPSLG